MTLWYLPLEPLEQRYTVMMNAALAPLVDVVLMPEWTPQPIRKGEFLDIEGTCAFKAAQLALVVACFQQGRVTTGDAFLAGDLFYPGLEMIRYMAELQGLQIRIGGINYAGRSDPADFVQRLGRWADASETAWHLLCDVVFVGSDFHAGQVKRFLARQGVPGVVPIQVTGYVWDIDYVRQCYAPGQDGKEDFIVWPHRLAPEKGWGDLLQYAATTARRIVVTSSGHPTVPSGLPPNVRVVTNLSKREYYHTMSRARWYLSTAYQETFGYTLQEAIVYGCEVLVPHRACYPEMVPTQNLYTTLDEIDARFDAGGLIVPLDYTVRWHDNARVLAARLRRAEGDRR